MIFFILLLVSTIRQAIAVEIHDFIRTPAAPFSITKLSKIVKAHHALFAVSSLTGRMHICPNIKLRQYCPENEMLSRLLFVVTNVAFFCFIQVSIAQVPGEESGLFIEENIEAEFKTEFQEE